MCQIFQIYYNHETFNLCDSRLLKLCNSDPVYPNLYEFSPIFNYLNSIDLILDDYYGFLSPRFFSKTLVNIEELLAFVTEKKKYSDVLLCTSGWDQICYFKNSFEQGEYFHPGLKEVTKSFLEYAGIDINIDSMIGTLSNTVNSNYIIANGHYWISWLNIASKFLQFYLNDHNGSTKLRNSTKYLNNPEMAVFLQERLHQILLWDCSYLVSSYDTTINGPMLLAMFDDTPYNRVQLRACEELKSEYLKTGNQLAFDGYEKIRSNIAKKI